MSGLVDLRAVRIAASAIVAGALCVVLATRVFTEFDAVRVKLVTLPVPAVDGTVRIDTSHDARTAQLSAPVALIAVLHNSLPAQQTVAIEVDDQPVCTATIAPLTSRRLDCVVSTGWVRGPAHQILLTGEGPDWSLEFLEIATHHGSSSRLFPFHVLPNVNADFHRPNWVVVGVTWLVLWGNPAGATGDHMVETCRARASRCGGRRCCAGSGHGGVAVGVVVPADDAGEFLCRIVGRGARATGVASRYDWRRCGSRHC